MNTNNEKNIRPYKSLEMVLGMREIPKVPEIEVYKGQQFLFSTGKKSNKQQENNDKTMNKQRQVHATISSVLRKPKIWLQHTSLGKNVGQFSLVSTHKGLSKSALNWFDKGEANYSPIISSLNLNQDKKLNKPKLKFQVFKCK